MFTERHVAMYRFSACFRLYKVRYSLFNEEKVNKLLSDCQNILITSSVNDNGVILPFIFSLDEIDTYKAVTVS